MSASGDFGSEPSIMGAGPLCVCVAAMRTLPGGRPHREATASRIMATLPRSIMQISTASMAKRPPAGDSNTTALA